jgi:hypothetical protein
LQTNFRMSVLAVVCAAALACNGGRLPAEAAMKTAEDAVRAARAEAERFAPDDFRSLSDDLNAARDQLARADYKTALASAASIPRRAHDVLARAGAKRDELTRTWNGLAGDVARMVEAARSRVDALSPSRTLPKGVDAGQLAAAKESLALATSAWDEAQAAFQAGHWNDAIARGRAAKERASTALTALGMSGGAAPGAVTSK